MTARPASLRPRKARPLGWGWGSIAAGGDEVMPVREAARRLALGRKATDRLKAAGLPVFTAGGRLDLVFASDLMRVLRAIRDEGAEK